jgi:hypothetical protein
MRRVTNSYASDRHTDRRVTCRTEFVHKPGFVARSTVRTARDDLGEQADADSEPGRRRGERAIIRAQEIAIRDGRAREDQRIRHAHVRARSDAGRLSRDRVVDLDELQLGEVH